MTDLTVTDSGLYVVEAENENGTTEKEFEIEVAGKLIFKAYCLIYKSFAIHYDFIDYNIYWKVIKKCGFEIIHLICKMTVKLDIFVFSFE